MLPTSNAFAAQVALSVQESRFVNFVVLRVKARREPLNVARQTADRYPVTPAPTALYPAPLSPARTLSARDQQRLSAHRLYLRRQLRRCRSQRSATGNDSSASLPSRSSSRAITSNDSQRRGQSFGCARITPPLQVPVRCFCGPPPVFPAAGDSAPCCF